MGREEEIVTAVPLEIRALARCVRQQGADVRVDAHHLVAHSRAVGWTGLAGAAMVGATTGQGDALRVLAEQHEAAARALERHAEAVEGALAIVAETERLVLSAVHEARGRVRRFVDGLLDAVDHSDEVLARFVPPPPGSPEWLHVRLPGVALPGPVR